MNKIRDIEAPQVPKASPKLRQQQLKDYAPEDLILNLYDRGITTDDIFGCYYAIAASRDHNDDEVFGYSEEGLHGRNHTR